MSPVLPPYLVVLDITALMAGSLREWQEFSRLGECFVPKVVLEEIQMMCDRASDPNLERLAREFMRFYPDSGWKPTSSIASHPTLKPAEGQNLSKRARLALTIAQSSYGLALNRPEGLVILVANDQGLMQRIKALELPNLCGIPAPVLVQWSRTERKPPAIIHQIQVMRSTVGAVASTPVRSPARVTAAPPTPVTPQRVTTTRSTKPAFRVPIAKIFFNLLTLVMVASVGLVAWRFLHPPSFAQFWRQLPLPKQPLEKVVPRK